MLQEYDFEVLHYAGITNLDADGLSRTPNPPEEDLTGARWHWDYDQETFLGWHAIVYLTLIFGFDVEILIHSSVDETNELRLLRKLGRIITYCISFSMGLFCLSRRWKGIGVDIE